MRVIKGDLIEMAKKGEFEVIIHGCNCFCTMNSGIAKQIKITWPQVYDMDLKTIRGDEKKLGTINVTRIPNGKKYLYVINAYTQYNYGIWKRQLDYRALQKCFHEVAKTFQGLHIAYPKIGADLGGGEWRIIKRIIETELSECNHTLVIK